MANSPFDAVGFTGPDSWTATRFYPDFFSYNFEPDNVLVLPMERWNIYSHFEIDVNDHFKPYATATFTNQDPCNTTGPDAGNAGFGRNGANGAQVQALCAAQSAVAGGASYFQPAGQANGITSGNPDLQNEQSDSWNFGVVVTEPWGINRFAFSIDYFNFEIDDVIQTVGAATIVQRCFNRDGANPNFSLNNNWCQQFARDQDNGQIWRETQPTPSHMQLDPGAQYQATLERGAIGGCRMQADGVRRMLKVERLK